MQGKGKMLQVSRARIPNEVLVKVFSYLPSNELLRIYSSCDNKHLKTILTDRSIVKCVDFCKERCTSGSIDLIKFLSACAEHVSSLCLNHCNCKFIPPNTVFYNFNSLTELHVKDCGFPVAFIAGNIPDLKSLQAFSCSLTDSCVEELSHFDQLQPEVSKSVRRLSIDINVKCAPVLRFILYKFSRITDLHINLYYLNEATMPWTPRNESLNLELTNLDTCTLSILGTDSSLSPANTTYLSNQYSSVLSMLALRNHSVKWKLFEAWEDRYFGTLFEEQAPPKSKRCICLPFALVKTEMDMEQLQFILKDAGDEVKFLFLNGISYSRNYAFHFMTFLDELISQCKNLTEVNLAGIHNTYPSGTSGLYTTMLDSLSRIHGLKRLVIPGCCINPLANSVTYAKFIAKRIKLMKDEDNDLEPDLMKLVDGCPSLIELDIRNTAKHGAAPCNCDSRETRLRDEDLAPLLRLQKLEHLTLKGLMPEVKLEFLKNLSASCPFLRTLRLAISGSNKCLYWPNLVTAFSTMNCLEEFSIEHDQLPIDGLEFWQDLGQLPSVVKVCIISSDFSGHLQAHFIMKFIHLVQTLKVLHVHSVARNFNVCSVLLARHLKNRKLDINIHYHRNPGLAKCKCGHFYEWYEMCCKGSTVGNLIDDCGLSRK